MILRKTSTILTLGVFSLVFLSNHDIFNFLLQGTPLVIWKQLLSVAFLVFSFACLESRKSNDGNLLRIRLLQRFLLILSILAGILSYANGLSFTRITYGTLAYIGFAGALGFAHVCLIKNKLAATLNLFFYIGLINSFGIVIDYFSPILDFLPRGTGNEFEVQIANNYLRRASFFFGTSTTIFPFLSFSIIAFAIMVQTNQTTNNIIKFTVLSIAVLTAVYLTGSRANFLLILVFLVAIFFIVFSFLTLKNKLLIIGILALTPALFNFILSFIHQGNILTERYTNVLITTDQGNLHRFKVWEDGRALFNESGISIITGNGIGSSLGMIDDGFRSTTHYESSVFQSFSEGGLFGLLLRFLPAILAVTFLIINGHIWSPIGKMFFLWITLYVVSVSVAPTAAAYHTQFVYFLACGLALQLSLVKNTLENNKTEMASHPWARPHYILERVQIVRHVR